MPTEIPLTQGQVALIDDSVLAIVAPYKWCALWNKNAKTFYAVAALWDKKRKRDIRISMHRLIMGISNSKIHVDHANHIGTDNQRNNLRICDPATNNFNRRKIKSKGSQYKGVRRNQRGGKWRAMIYKNRKRIPLGSFVTEDEAALAYNRAALLHFGEFAFLNTIPKENCNGDSTSFPAIEAGTAAASQA